MLTFYRAYHYGDKLWNKSTRSRDELHDFYSNTGTTGGAITHAGGFEGANTVIYEVLRDEISIIVFANMDEVVAEDLGLGILYLIRGKEPASPSLPANQAVYAAYTQHGAAYIKKHWEELSKNFHPADPKDLILNNIGYDLLFDGHTSDAVDIFKLNTELFPDIGNCWDSYGEGLLKMGDKKAALAAYKKALSINPDIPTAQDAVRHLSQ
jgi:tetratricopeptide (TPR) repeat protein